MNNPKMDIDKETLRHLWSSVHKWGKTPQQKEEFFVACYEAYYLKARNKEISIETKESYLSVVFKNACRDCLRKEYKRQQREILFTDMDEEWREIPFVDTSEIIESNVYVNDFLDSLSDVERQFAQHLIEDTPYQDISDEMNIPVGTIRSRIHRYRAKWKPILQRKLKILKNPLAYCKL